MHQKVRQPSSKRKSDGGKKQPPVKVLGAWLRSKEAVRTEFASFATMDSTLHFSLKPKTEASDFR